MGRPVEAGASPIPAWIIREATPADAAALIAYVKAMLAGPEANMPLASDEFAWTVEAEQDNLAEMAAADNSLVLLAVADDQIIGELSLRGGQRRATHHAAMLGMSVHQDERNRGIGSALMAYAIDWATKGGVLTRIELYVYASNARAIHLYEKFGFTLEGRRRQAIYQNGQYRDDLIMGLLL